MVAAPSCQLAGHTCRAAGPKGGGSGAAMIILGRLASNTAPAHSFKAVPGNHASAASHISAAQPAPLAHLAVLSHKLEGLDEAQGLVHCTLQNKEVELKLLRIAHNPGTFRKARALRCSAAPTRHPTQSSNRACPARMPANQPTAAAHGQVVDGLLAQVALGVTAWSGIA